MMRYIDISNAKGRNAEVYFSNASPKKKVIYVTADTKEKPKTIKFIKTVQATDLIIEKYGASLADALINDDPEIDLEKTGRMIGKASKILLDSKGDLAYKVKVEEEVYDPEGNLKEVREPKRSEKNITTENKGEIPLKAGKLFPKKDIYNKFIFAKKYQIHHVNGLTYDFLFDIAKELDEKQSMMMIGAGPKGNAPLVFQDGGKSYRGFLEGRVKGDTYILILHITNLEFKPISKK